MKSTLRFRAPLLALLGAGLLSLFPHPSQAASLYAVGDVVSNFSLYARRAFTNDAGQVVSAGSPVRLTDFDGKILFLEFFYEW